MGSLKYESIRNQLDELMGPNRNGDLKAESIISVGPIVAAVVPALLLANEEINKNSNLRI